MDKNTITPQEIREAVRQYVINNYETYEAIAAHARQLAAIAKETRTKINAFAVEETGAPIVSSPEDLAALISVILAETDEVLNWELIGKYNVKG